jgi:GTPase SAR1 family protein
MYYVFLLGPAGSGKSLLTAVFHDWLEEHGISVATLNLDPAADWLPYTPDVDIRSYITVEDVMKRYNLGPNGALVTAVDLSINYIKELVDEIDEMRPNYVIVDTPGQLEVFAFRKAGSIMIDSLSKNFKTVVLFLLESYSLLKPSTLIPLSVLSLATSLSHKKPQITVITKSDLLSKEESMLLTKLLENPLDTLTILKEREFFAISETPSDGIMAIIETAIRNTLEEAVLVSAIIGQGIDELYASIQRILAGGEDFYTEEPSEAL